jgi:hypothetical protein
MSPSTHTFWKASDIARRFGGRKEIFGAGRRSTSIYAVAMIVIVDIWISPDRVTPDQPKFGYGINITNSFGEDDDALATSY